MLVSQSPPVAASSQALQCLRAELFARCMQSDGTAFVMPRHLGDYQQHFVRTADGWQMDTCSPLQTIDAAVAQLRALQAAYPAIAITYPQQLLEDGRTVPGVWTAWVCMRATAQIAVPAEFVALHGGHAFAAVLQRDWKASLARLTAEAVRLVQKHEIRSALLFDAPAAQHTATLSVGETQVSTAIWTLPLKKLGLYPLQWDGEVCGMARALSAELLEALRPICGASLRVQLRHGTEQSKICAMDWTWTDWEGGGSNR